MKKQLTLDNILKLRSETKDPILLAILNDAEWKLGEGREIEWHYADPIPPRPWREDSGMMLDATGNDRISIGLQLRNVEHAREIAQFIVERVNAGERHKSIECLNTPEESALDVLKEYKETVSQAHSILDAMGVPKAERVECNRPDCNSLLIHRLHTLQSNLTMGSVTLNRKHSHNIEPAQPANNQHVSVQHVLGTLCSICTTVMAEKFKWQDSADCFCGQNTGKPEDFRFSSMVLQFISDAVQEKIERFKASASLP